MKINGMVLFFLIVFLEVFSTQATAASFDCKKASTWLEKKVCSNPELSKLDEQMADAYQDALANSLPDEQKKIKEHQKKWLKRLLKSLQTIKHDCNEFDECINNSLLYDYEKRIDQLHENFIRFSDRIFRNIHIDHSRQEKDCEEDSKKKVWIGKFLSYPQIKNPRDENEKLWNIVVSKKAGVEFKQDEKDKCTHLDDKYIVSFNNKHLISIYIDRQWVPEGAGRGFRKNATFPWLIEQRRELQTTDIFDDKTNWRKKIEDLLAQKLKEGKEEATTDKIYPSAIKEAVSSPEKWEISKDSLSFGLEYNYPGSSHFFVKLEWKILEPYISKDGRSLIYD